MSESKVSLYSVMSTRMCVCTSTLSWVGEEDVEEFSACRRDEDEGPISTVRTRWANFREQTDSLTLLSRGDTWHRETKHITNGWQEIRMGHYTWKTWHLSCDSHVTWFNWLDKKNWRRLLVIILNRKVNRLTFAGDFLWRLICAQNRLKYLTCLTSHNPIKIRQKMV